MLVIQCKIFIISYHIKRLSKVQTLHLPCVTLLWIFNCKFASMHGQILANEEKLRASLSSSLGSDIHCRMDFEDNSATCRKKRNTHDACLAVPAAQANRTSTQPPTQSGMKNKCSSFRAVQLKALERTYDIYLLYTMSTHSASYPRRD